MDQFFKEINYAPSLAAQGGVSPTASEWIEHQPMHMHAALATKINRADSPPHSVQVTCSLGQGIGGKTRAYEPSRSLLTTDASDR